MVIKYIKYWLQSQERKKKEKKKMMYDYEKLMKAVITKKEEEKVATQKQLEFIQKMQECNEFEGFKGRTISEASEYIAQNKEIYSEWLANQPSQKQIETAFKWLYESFDGNRELIEKYLSKLTKENFSKFYEWRKQETKEMQNLQQLLGTAESELEKELRDEFVKADAEARFQKGKGGYNEELANQRKLIASLNYSLGFAIEPEELDRVSQDELELWIEQIQLEELAK